MIWESSYWKDDLIREAKSLKNIKRRKNLTERDCLAIEKKIFIAFYSIRKLMDAQKLSTKYNNIRIPVTSYPSTGKHVDALNWHKIDNLYKLDHAQEKKKKIRYLCDQIIHSFIFMVETDESRRLCGIYFCSDRKKSEEVFQVNIDQIITLFEEIGNDYPMYAHWIRDLKTREWKLLEHG